MNFSKGKLTKKRYLLYLYIICSRGLKKGLKKLFRYNRFGKTKTLQIQDDNNLYSKYITVGPIYFIKSYSLRHIGEVLPIFYFQ